MEYSSHRRKRLRSMFHFEAGNFMIRSRSSFALLLSVALSAGVLLAQEAAAPEQKADEKAPPPGEHLFKQQCAVCHSLVPDKKLVGPSLHGELSGPAPKKTPAEARTIILNGKGAMTGFKDQLSSQEIDDLLTYLKSQ
jgi:mono/diheme cytochrome c family protein